MKPSIETWNEVAKLYTMSAEPAEKEIAEELSTLFAELKVSKKTNLIELGCGSGHIAGELARKGYRTTLLDFSPIALQKAHNYYDHEGLEGEFIQADLTNLRGIDVKNALLWNSGVMEHFDDANLLKAFRSIRSLLTTETCIFLVPNERSLPYRMMRFSRMNEGSWNYGTEYLRDNYEAILEQSGFRVLQKRYLGKGFAKHFFNLLNTDPRSRGVFSSMLERDLIPENEYYLVAFIVKPGKRSTSTQVSKRVQERTREFDKAARQAVLPHPSRSTQLFTLLHRFTGG